MQGFFSFLQQNPFLLLFFVVGLAVWIGRANIKGYGLGMVAGAIVVGAALSVTASLYGVKLELNNFAKSLFYYLFMYGVGLRVGPSFINSLKGGGLTGYRQFGLRAYRLENPAQVGKSITSFRKANPEYRIVNVSRGGEQLGADPGLVLRKGDIIALGGATEHLTDKMGLIGPEVADPKTLGIPMDQAEILVTNKEVVGRTFESFRGEAMAGQLQVTKVERGGVTIPAGLKTELQRMDIVSVVGLKSAVNELAEMWGRIARTNKATHLPTPSCG